MKVLSIMQPWASLIVLGHKKIETRSRNTNYNGEILIHASAGKRKEGRTLAEGEASHLLPEGIRRYSKGNSIVVEKTHFDNLPFGAIIGKARLRTSFSTSVFQPGYSEGIFFEDAGAYFTEQEVAFGNYDIGRYGWLLSDPVMFEKPIPAKGQLGLWNWEGVLPK